MIRKSSTAFKKIDLFMLLVISNRFSWCRKFYAYRKHRDSLRWIFLRVIWSKFCGYSPEDSDNFLSLSVSFFTFHMFQFHEVKDAKSNR